MKKSFLISIVLLSYVSFGQDFKEMNKLSVGASIGGHDAFYPTNTFTRVFQIHHFGLNGRYMLNNRFGVMADLGYDFIDAYKSGTNNVNYFRVSLQGVMNLGDIMRFDSWSNKIGLLGHAGAGLSTMWAPTMKKSNANDPFLKNSDDMGNFIFGITPQYKINERISLNADLSLILHSRQDHTFDYATSKLIAFSGYFVNWSIGASYYLGKKEKHADWTSTIYGAPVQKQDTTKKIVLDDDEDGVPNTRDIEPKTPKEAYVDSKGAAIKDTDGDGVLDSYDLCPEVKGTFSMNGCQDSDGDGVADNADACPTVKGSIMNNGCPVDESNNVEEFQEIQKKTMDKALKNVQFKTNEDVLLKSSYASLDDVLKVLNASPSNKLKIDGHTDDIGTEEFNMTLSERRANVCAKYLIEKGISADRLIIKGFGKTKPLTTNRSEEGKALNRRVEFTVVF
jgi:OOP family OmpA-OmpF porin